MSQSSTLANNLTHMKKKDKIIVYVCCRLAAVQGVTLLMPGGQNFPSKCVTDPWRTAALYKRDGSPVELAERPAGSFHGEQDMGSLLKWYGEFCEMQTLWLLQHCFCKSYGNEQKCCSSLEVFVPSCVPKEHLSLLLAMAGGDR